jgi:hypothetical protein
LTGDCVVTGVKGHSVAVTRDRIIDEKTCYSAVKQQSVSIERQEAVTPVGIASDLGSPLGTDVTYPNQVGGENAVFQGFGPTSDGSAL